MVELPRNRTLLRGIHVVLVTCLGTYLYSPLAELPAAELIVQTLVFSGLAASGLLLWRGTLFRHWIRRRRIEREHR